jgi:hypothetical protein
MAMRLPNWPSTGMELHSVDFDIKTVLLFARPLEASANTSNKDTDEETNKTLHAQAKTFITKYSSEF